MGGTRLLDKIAHGCKMNSVNYACELSLFNTHATDFPYFPYFHECR